MTVRSLMPGFCALLPILSWLIAGPAFAVAGTEASDAAANKAKGALQSGAADDDESVDGDDELGLEQDSEGVLDDDLPNAADVDVEKAAEAYLEQSQAQPGAPGTAVIAPRTEKATINVPTATAPAPNLHGETATAKATPIATALKAQAVPKPTLTRPQIISLQQALNAGGAKLTADGQMGNRTRVALKDFQKTHGLSVTGEADIATMKQLGVQ